MLPGESWGNRLYHFSCTSGWRQCWTKRRSHLARSHQGECKAPDDSYRHFLEVITSPVSETAFWALSQASSYLLKHQMQYEPSDRWLCSLLPPSAYKSCCWWACSSIHPVYLLCMYLFIAIFNLTHYLQNVEMSERERYHMYIKHTEVIFNNFRGSMVLCVKCVAGYKPRLAAPPWSRESECSACSLLRSLCDSVIWVTLLTLHLHRVEGKHALDSVIIGISARFVGRYLHCDIFFPLPLLLFLSQTGNKSSLQKRYETWTHIKKQINTFIIYLVG